jgi:hypothetical protein
MKRILLLIPCLILSMPIDVQAQFTFATNSGTLTITAYTGTTDPVVIPDMTNGLPVISIGTRAFDEKVLTNVFIPDSIVNIGNYAFFGCIGLTSITIPPGVTNIGAYSFLSTSLTNIVIPDGVIYLGLGAFQSCGLLTSAKIGTGVTNIGSGTFVGCTKLSSFYFTGAAPSTSGSLGGAAGAVVYYLPGTTGWGPTFGGFPTALWKPKLRAASFNIGAATNQFGFTTDWASGMTVVVEASTGLTSPNWSPVATNILTSDGTSYFSDPQWTNYPGHFYRIQSR